MEAAKEIIENNEELVEIAVEEIASKGSRKGLRIAAGAGVAVILGGLAIKFVVLPAIAKFRAKKNEDPDDYDDSFEDYEEEDVFEESNETKNEETTTD